MKIEMESEKGKRLFIGELRKSNPTLAEDIVKQWNEAIEWIEEMDKKIY